MRLSVAERYQKNPALTSRISGRRSVRSRLKPSFAGRLTTVRLL